MPSPKLVAALRERPQAPVTNTSGKSTVRFSTTHPDPAIAKLQEDLRSQDEKQFADTPFKNGELLDITFETTGAKEIPHNLGGQVKGFIVVDKISPAGAFDVLRDDATSADAMTYGRTNTHVRLRSTVSGAKAKVWVWR